MVLSKFFHLAVLASALASPALACVQFSANYDYGSQNFNAALTDNGGQTCQISNINVGQITTATQPVQLSCIGGYSASFDMQTFSVTYQALSGQPGNFGTVIANQGTAMYYTANVWGC